MTQTLISPTLLSPLANLRDLGGIQARTGTTRHGAVWRADDLSLVDAESARKLIDDGLNTIIDLRSPAEVELTGRGLLGAQPLAYHHIPFMSSIGRAGVSTAEMMDQSRFEQMYISIYENAAPQIVSALAVIAHAPGTVAFHCAAGQDRTGILAAALLLSVEVEPAHIISDYVRTGPNSPAIRQRIRPVLEPLMARLGISAEAAAQAALREDFSPAPMLGLISHLERTYADPLLPLRRVGLSDALIDGLRTRTLS